MAKKTNNFLLKGTVLCIHFFKFFFQVAFIHLDRDIILTINEYVITRSPCISINHDNNSTWSLKIHNVRQEDKGFYKCQLNSDPQISTVGFLDVVGTYIKCNTTFSKLRGRCKNWGGVGEQLFQLKSFKIFQKTLPSQLRKVFIQ